jgi:hypothetical protein
MKKCHVTLNKQYGGLGAASGWSNTYTVLGPDDLNDAAWGRAINAFHLAESKWAVKPVQFVGAMVSTTAKGDSYGTDVNSVAWQVSGTGTVDTVANLALDSKALPGELCIVGGLSGGGTRISRMLYRHSLGPNDWYNTGGGVIATFEKQQEVNNQLNQVREFLANDPDLTWLMGGGTEDSRRNVTQVGYKTIEHRQLHNTRQGKDIFLSGDPEELEEMVIEARKVATEISATVGDRYTVAAAGILGAGATLLTLKSVRDAAIAAIDVINKKDFGPAPIPVP